MTYEGLGPEMNTTNEKFNKNVEIRNLFETRPKRNLLRNIRIWPKEGAFLSQHKCQ